VFVTSKVAFFPTHDDSLWMYEANNVKGDEAASIETALTQLQLLYVSQTWQNNSWRVKPTALTSTPILNLVNHPRLQPQLYPPTHLSRPRPQPPLHRPRFQPHPQNPHNQIRRPAPDSQPVHEQSRVPLQRIAPLLRAQVISQGLGCHPARKQILGRCAGLHLCCQAQRSRGCGGPCGRVRDSEEELACPRGGAQGR
jgi:hypothetical protein